MPKCTATPYPPLGTGVPTPGVQAVLMGSALVSVPSCKERKGRQLAAWNDQSLNSAGLGSAPPVPLPPLQGLLPVVSADTTFPASACLLPSLLLATPLLPPLLGSLPLPPGLAQCRASAGSASEWGWPG